MREAMTPDEFNRWIAFRQICPDKMERLIYVCKCGLALLANAWGAKIDPDDLDPQKYEKAEQFASPDQAAAMVKMTMGSSNG